MNFQECIDQLLMDATYDWLCVGDFLRVAMENVATKNLGERDQTALRLMKEIVRQGLMEVGDLPKIDTGQRPRPLKKWTGTTEEWLARIEREWPRLRGKADYGVYCWFQITPKGDEIAQQLLAQKDRETQNDS